ncbi:MAG: CarD family transcriptional regulator [Bryobacterales bacterium]|nr:CarD family transcriptional regulator [Bryobacterales bacterium]
MLPGLSFQVGERVVYPNHGVGTIENISTRTFGARTERFYLLRLAGNSLTIMVPFSHVNEVGLRKVTRNADVQRVLEFLACGKAKPCSDWKNRFKENSEKMRVGALHDIAEVFKCLLLQQKEKTLSFREKKMLDRARQMLVMEVSTARTVSLDQATEILRKALIKSSLNMPEPL